MVERRCTADRSRQRDRKRERKKEGKRGGKREREGETAGHSISTSECCVSHRDDRTRNRSDRGIPRKLNCKHTTCLYRRRLTRGRLCYPWRRDVVLPPFSHGRRLIARNRIAVSDERFLIQARARSNGDVVEMSEPCASPMRYNLQSAISAAAKSDFDPTRSNETPEHCGGVPVVSSVDSLDATWIEDWRLLRRIANCWITN